MAAAQRLLHDTPLGLWYFARLANRQVGIISMHAQMGQAGQQ